MAVVATNLTSGNFTGSFTTRSTASISPTANSLILLTVSVRNGASINPTLSSVTGNGLTWVLLTGGSSNYDSSSSSRRSIHVYRALGASPSAGTVTMNFTETETDITWGISEFSGVDTSGTNGSGAIVQVVNNKDESGSVSTLTVTLAAFGSANNATFGAFGAASSVTFTAGSGFTILDQQVASLTVAHGTEFRNSNDTSVDISLSGNDFIGGVAVEIKAAAGTDHTKSLSDTVTLSDTITIKAIGKGLSDTITLSDAFARAWTALRTFTDTITMSDAIVKAFGKFLSDTITLSDAVAKAVTTAFSDSMTLSDNIVKSFGKYLSDTITMSDAFTTVKGILLMLSDTITMSDSFSTFFNSFLRLPKIIMSYLTPAPGGLSQDKKPTGSTEDALSGFSGGDKPRMGISKPDKPNIV